MLFFKVYVVYLLLLNITCKNLFLVFKNKSINKWGFRLLLYSKLLSNWTMFVTFLVVKHQGMDISTFSETFSFQICCKVTWYTWCHCLIKIVRNTNFNSANLNSPQWATFYQVIRLHTFLKSNAFFRLGITFLSSAYP